jgi:hypothetical protein
MINTLIPTSTSVKLPKLKNQQKFLITEPDDRGFAQEQVDKLIQGIYLRRQLQLKPWEKDSYKNIYQSSGKSNHQILQSLRAKMNSCRTISVEDNSFNYYKDHQLKSINDSQEISKQIHSNSEIRRKFKIQNTNIKNYTNETKQICKNKLLADLINIEREKMEKKKNEYEKALKNEIKNLNKDIFTFEQFVTNEMFQNNQQSKYFKNIQSNKNNLTQEIKKLSQEYHSIKADMQRTLKQINDKKIYVNFVHRLFGGDPELANCNLDDINFQNLNDTELHALTRRIEREMKKTKSEDNILITSTDEELLGNINKMDIVFKIMEENILKTLAKKEKLRNEIVLINEEEENEKEEMLKKIEERDKEYKSILLEYKGEKNSADFISFTPEEYIEYIRKLHIELFESIKDVSIKNKKDIDEYNIIDKIIKPTLRDITDKERKIDSLIIDMEKYSKQDKVLFNASVGKIKNENKILKYYEERNNREVANAIRNTKILDKINKVLITGKHKYNNPIPLSILKKRRNNTKELKTEPSDIKLLYY